MLTWILPKSLCKQRRPETLQAELICHSGEWETCPRCVEEAVRQLTLTDMQSYISHRGKLLPGRGCFFFFMLWYKSPNPVRSQVEKPGLIKKKKKRGKNAIFIPLHVSLHRPPDTELMLGERCPHFRLTVGTKWWSRSPSFSLHQLRVTFKWAVPLFFAVLASTFCEILEMHQSHVCATNTTLLSVCGASIMCQSD